MFLIASEDSKGNLQDKRKLDKLEIVLFHAALVKTG